jgi:hypothetical protein
MKLSSTLVRRTLDQIDAHAIPENHPAVARLHDLFGEHTFFLDQKGLNIIEPTDASDTHHQSAQVINLADWRDSEQTSLEAHDPEPTDTFIELDEDDDGPIDGSGFRPHSH